MTQPGDHDWERLLERVDLDVSDAELAAAEQELRKVAPEDVAPVQPAWIEATVAKAVAAAPERVAERNDVPARSSGWFGRLQRLAAAAVAFVALHSKAAAASVVGVGVVTVVTVTLLWPNEQNSRELSYGSLVQILISENATQNAKEAAMGEVSLRLRRYLSFLQDAQQANSPGSPWFEAASARLVEFRALLATPSGSLPVPIVDDFEACYASAKGGSLDSLRRLADLATNGVHALQQVQPVNADLALDRDRYLARLRRLAGP